MQLAVGKIFFNIGEFDSKDYQNIFKYWFDLKDYQNIVEYWFDLKDYQTRRVHPRKRTRQEEQR